MIPVSGVKSRSYCEENIMMGSSGIKSIRRDHKQRRNGEACRARPMCFWPSLINFRSKDTIMVFY